jgi:hypothetical protein
VTTPKVWRAGGGRCGDGDRGITLVLVAVLMTAILIMAAIVIDIGYLRGGARFDQKVADLAALAAGKKLGAGDYGAACQDIIGYLNTNAPDMPAINASGFCGQAGNNVSQTTCTPPGSLAQARPTTTSGRYTVSVHFPVPASEIADPHFGNGINDGAPCDRMRVIVKAEEPSFFGGAAGGSGTRATRSATVKASSSIVTRIPALWLLDPTGCVALAVSGGSQVQVGTTTVPGYIAVDSSGSSCTGSQNTISATGSGTNITAVPTTGTDAGVIGLFAMGTGATTCIPHACDPSDVSGGRVAPQPKSSGDRATRAPVDWRYNCKTGYPAYHGIAMANCPSASTTPAYVDLLRAAVGTSGQPTGYQRWRAGHSCNPSGAVVVTGNWWIDCPGGLNIGNGATVTFANGNVVFDSGLSMSNGGALNINTANSTPHLSNTCLPPTVTTPCIASASADAGIAYFRAGNITLTGGTFRLNHTAVYLASGYVKANSSAPSWTAPVEGPFAGLSLWSELSSGQFQIAGGAGVSLAGTFFTPEAAPLSLSGGGNWGQQHAQFISYQLAVSGGGHITLSPDPNSSINLPPKAGVLIR